MKTAELAVTGYTGKSLHDYMKMVHIDFAKGELKTDIQGYRAGKEGIIKNLLANNPTIIIGPTGCGKSNVVGDIQNAIKDYSRQNPRWEIQGCPGHQDAYFLALAKNALDDPKAKIERVVKMLDDQFCPGCQAILYNATGSMWPADLLKDGGSRKRYAEAIGEIPVERTRYDNIKINMEQNKSPQTFVHEFLGTPNLHEYFGGGRAIDPKNVNPGKAFEPGILILEEMGRSPRDVLEVVMQATSDDAGIRKLSLFTGGLYHVDNVIIGTSNSPMQGDNAVKGRFEFIAWGGLPDKDLAKSIAKEKFETYIDLSQTANGHLCEPVTREFLPRAQRNIYISTLALEYIGYVMSLTAPEKLRGDAFKGTQEEYMKEIGALHASRTDVQRANFFEPRRLTRLVRELVTSWEVDGSKDIVVTPSMLEDRWNLDTSYAKAVNDARVKVKELISRAQSTTGTTMDQAKQMAQNIGKIREDIAKGDRSKFRALVEAIEGQADIPQWAILPLLQDYTAWA